jgi:hypothetical protein
MKLDLDEMLELLSRTDPGPWTHNKNQIANIRFCALARTWVPQLIGEIQRLRRGDD